MNRALLRGNPRDLVEQHIDIFLTTEDGTQGPGNFIGRKQSRRNLVQHRTKEMIIPFVNQRHAKAKRGVRPGPRRVLQAAADNDHMRRHQLHPTHSNTSLTK